MSEEKWLTDINKSIDHYVELDIYTLEKLAERNDVEVSYVLETYRDKIVYKINNMLKQGL